MSLESRPDLPPMNRTSDRTVSALLEAGRAQVIERGMSSVLPVKITDVTSRLGYTTGAAYQRWRKQADFQRALSNYIVEQSFLVEPAEVVRQLTAELRSGVVAPEPGAIEEHFERLFATLVTSLTAQPDYYLNLHFLSVAVHETALRSPMNDAYQNLEQAVAGALDAMITAAGRSMRASCLVHWLAGALISLAEGQAVRCLLASDLVGGPSSCGDDGTDPVGFEGVAHALLAGCTSHPSA